jgi:DNA helicase IV
LAPHPELVAEQSYLDRVYERLREQRERASEQLTDVLMQGGVTPQSVVEREMMAEHAQMRLGQLDVGHLPICFGRIDRDQTPSEAGMPGEAFYIGRMGVWDSDQDPLVIDWRAPVAEPFYRATGRHPMGLARRRHFMCVGQTIEAIEDEVFDPDSLGDTDVEMVGAGALLAALERDRTGRMHDIVATVQREQDEVIRGSMHGVLVVQGGPGTGKTAVALHRAAYLLYTHRFPLERQGVLVVGPNPLFLRYIDQVLPSLGETGVGLYTVDGLVRALPDSKVSKRGVEADAVARVKGDERMIGVLARAVKDRQRPLAKDVRIPFGAFTLTLHVDESAEIVNAVKRRPGTHNARRRQVEQRAMQKLLAAHERAIAAIRPATESAPQDEELKDAAAERERETRTRLSRVPEFVAAMDRMWPVISPEEFLHDLLGARALVRLAARNALSDEEVDLLVRPRSHSFEDVPWTSADMALLDELRVHLGKASKVRANGDDEIRQYGHVVVDEAQDLSPMQLRVLARRSLGSMTIVGDVAQASGHWAPSSWDQVLAHLPSVGSPARLTELTVNYRTPGAIMDVAASVLAEAAPELHMPRSARPGGQPPRVVTAGSADDIGAALAEAVLHEKSLGGTLAVVCTPDDEAGLASALTNAGITVGRDEDGLEEPVSLVPVALAKGLEFDSVIVVEPAAIVDNAKFGLRALFVALTRATKRVTIVHSRTLPPSLARGLGPVL